MSAILKLVNEFFNQEVKHFEETYDVEFPFDENLAEQIKFVEEIDANCSLLLSLKAENEYNELLGGLNDIDQALDDWSLGESDAHENVKAILKEHESDEKFARKCDVTGEGMNSGWCFGDGSFYAKYKKDALAECIKDGYASLQEAYDADYVYWTEWDVEEDENYYNLKGDEFNPDGTPYEE